MADDNVRLFPRLGVADPPADPIHDPLADPDPRPEDGPDGPDEGTGARRRSPLETLAALSEPTATEPLAHSESDPEHEPAGDGGEIPAMFQSESWGHGSSAQSPDPGLGALSLAAVLAVSVAAMRGIHGALTGTRASREQRKTVADLAASGRGDKSGTGKGAVPSSHDFGRRSLGRDRSSNRPSFFGGGGAGRGGRRNGGGPGGFFGGSSSGRRGSTPGGSRSTGGLFSGGGGSSRRGGTDGAAGGSSGPGARKGAGPRSPLGPSSSGGARPGKSSSGGVGKTGTGSAGKSGTGGTGRTGTGTGGGRGPRRTSQGAGWLRRSSKAKGPAGSGGSSTGSGSSSGGGSKSAAKGPAAKGKAPNPKIPGPTAKTKGMPPKGAGPKAKSPKASTGPKGTLRPKRPKSGRPGVGAPGGAPPRKRNGKPVTHGSTKLPKGYFHGTIPGWEEGCRCPACTRAWAKANAVVGTKVKGARHGSIAAYEDDECRCTKCVKAAVRRSNARPLEPVTLGRAIGNTFERRWAKRTQPLVSTQSPKTRRKAAKKKDAARKKKAAAAAAVAVGGPVVDLKKKLRVDLHKKVGRTTPPGTAPGGTGPGAGHPGPSGPGVTKHRRTSSGGHWSRERRRSYERAAGPAGPAEDEFWFTFTSGSGMRRTTPWESVAAATSGPEVVIGTGQLTRPGETKRRPAGPTPAADPVGLPAARPSTPPAPPPAPEAAAGASIPEQRGAGMSLPAHILPTSLGMHSQHDTEVTLDDVLDDLEQLTGESFTAHEKSIVIAIKAREVRDELEALSMELAVHHNVIGKLTAAAMAFLAESMDLLAAKGDEMRDESLNAAEESETTQFSMADEYRPVQQATADANLIVPSARIHNEG